jgi:iron(III) transport system permease protein
MASHAAGLATPHRIRLERVLPRLGLIAFIGALGYLTLWPLLRLQYLALKDGAQGYSDAYTRPGWWTTVKWTIELGLGSLAIALVLGTALAWAAQSLPPRLGFLRVIPILPIVVPAVASVLGWAFLLSPHPGYLNQLLRLLPWWHGDFEGPATSHAAVIIIITGPRSRHSSISSSARGSSKQRRLIRPHR